MLTSLPARIVGDGPRRVTAELCRIRIERSSPAPVEMPSAAAAALSGDFNPAAQIACPRDKEPSCRTR
jgi:hypothetical protein